ncbi:hypothetical protein DFH28DRAFT_932828 [Melampsora americana]|nr:hypothetical protein DFH28DRAFT_932828 [Melampsora americana]
MSFQLIAEMAGLDVINCSFKSSIPLFPIHLVSAVQLVMCSILNVIPWAKVKKQPLMTGNQFETWAEEALKFPVKQACVSLKQRYNLIKRACQQIPINNGEAQERKLNNENDAEEIEIIVDKYTCQTRYQGLPPSVPDSTGFTVVKTGNQVPPRQRHGYVDTPPNCFAGPIQGVSNRTALDQPSCEMREYTDFVKIANPDILTVLTHKEITNHHQFSTGKIKIYPLCDIGFLWVLLASFLTMLINLMNTFVLKSK